MRNRLCGRFSQRHLPTSQIRGNDMGHDVGDTRLWTNTVFVQILLNHYGIQSLPGESRFDPSRVCCHSPFSPRNGTTKIIRPCGSG